MRNRPGLRFEPLEARRVLFSPIATGDFNGDGFEDGAVGIPFEDVGSVADAGAVNVIYGSANGLTAGNNQFIHQDLPNVLGQSQVEDIFGIELAIGDFNGDSFDDLAVGIPGEQVGSMTKAGAVQIFFGSTLGLKLTNSQLLNQNTAGIPGVAGANDYFGQTLATGDFDADGFDDLVVGVPSDLVASVSAGTVTVIRGSATGLVAAGSQLWTQDSQAVFGVAEQGDQFGAALAVGDFDHDNHLDLAIGAWGDQVNGQLSAGAVNVLYGTSNGLTSARNQIWHQNSVATLDSSETDDWFGFALSAGDFDGNGFSDLAVGVPNESWGAIGGPTDLAGAVGVFYGSSAGIASAGNQLFTQDSQGVPGVGESTDNWGYSLAKGDFNADGFDELIVGAPFDRVGGIANAGSVTVFQGGSMRLSGTNSKLWTQNSQGIFDFCEEYDLFGLVAVGDFDGNGRDDLAIAAPGESVGTIQGAGSVNVIYSGLSGLVSAGNQVWSQNSPGILDTSEVGDCFPFVDAQAARKMSLSIGEELEKLRKQRLFRL